MTEKQQGTSATMRERMLRLYGLHSHHKHDKNHLRYKLHSKSRPRKSLDGHGNEEANVSTGLLREFKLRKIRKRLDKGRFH